MRLATPVEWVMDGQRTIKLPFFLEMADVCDLDDGGGTGRGQIPAAAVDSVLWRP
mgnify:CR=1 FL=1